MALSKVDLANQVENQLPQNLVANNLPFRNIIINGDMSIAQRGTSSAGITATGYYTVDRWNLLYTNLGTWTQSQDSDVPSGQGFATSLKMACTTSATPYPASNSRVIIRQLIEGQNLQYLKKGTANAESLSLSFWIKSNKTGTYTSELYDADNTRQISKTFTINVADTWEKKTIIYAGDTTGTLNNDNTDGLTLFLWFGAGTTFTSGTFNTSWNADVTENRVSPSQVNLADSTSNYINITGVQLEAGTTASDFEFLPYDVNLGRCQRYYYAHTPKSGSNNIIGNAAFYTATSPRSVIQFPVTMRAVPSLSHSTGTDYYGVLVDNQLDTFNDFSVAYGTQNSILLIVSSNVSQTIGYAGYFLTKTNGYIDLDAEL
jgi:hypothetical protein